MPQALSASERNFPPEPELMRIFGVGRSTVREAVRILSDMGLLRVRQGAGTFVVSRNAPDLMTQRLKRADIRELDEVRRILEAAIVERPLKGIQSRMPSE